MPMLKRDARTAYLLIAPAFLLFLGFTLYPLLWSANISLTSWDGLNAVRHFVGFDNYRKLLTDPEFQQSVRVTALYVVGVTTASTVLGFALALLLQNRARTGGIYRTIFFSPVVTATVAAGVVWQLLFDPFTGFINTLLRDLGFAGANWLSDPHLSLFAVGVVGVWKRAGFAMVIYAAGLASLPTSVYEAAAIDGAGGWKMLRHVTVPLMRPITSIVLITGFIDAVQVFDHIFIMTNGGPIGSTNVLSLYLYNEGFRLFKLGYASAVGWVLFAIVLVLTILQWQMRRGDSK
ncbi:MAG: carbohydrate ABC transporter permease [Candidatus Nanopelagicales bacterium]